MAPREVELIPDLRQILLQRLEIFARAQLRVDFSRRRVRPMAAVMACPVTARWVASGPIGSRF
jgi:hypothetical protein